MVLNSLFMVKPSLTHYVIAVICVMALVAVVIYFLRGSATAQKFGIFALGFLFGMLAMYIAMHVYSHQ